jgi:tripartite-type tricarboxylate transporter receptor subunit TctC
MKKLLALFLLLFGIAHAQTHTFKFILSSGPGSGSDVTLETYAHCLKQQSILVLKDFKPGAEGLVAIKALQNAQDTDNITHVLLGNFGLNVLGKFPGIDLLNDINPITYINSTPLVIVGKNGKYKSMDDLLSESKPINIGSPSSSGTFLVENLFKELKISYQIIPYKNNVTGLTDLINGSLDLFVDTYIGARPLIEADKLIMVTSTFDKRTAKKYNHESIEKYSLTLSKMPLGLILSVQPSVDNATKNMIIKAIHNCGKDNDIVQKLEKAESHPIFISTEEIKNIVKSVAKK